MFKKSLAVLAVLGAFAGVSSAAEVTLYGRVDAGLQYQHIDQDEANVDDDDNFAMKSGFTTGSRWGMKGTEDLGNGMTVGFVLENGFNVDDARSPIPTASSIVNRRCSSVRTSANSRSAASDS